MVIKKISIKIFKLRKIKIIYIFDLIILKINYLFKKYKRYKYYYLILKILAQFFLIEKLHLQL